MNYPRRLAVALLGCATIFHADARLLVPPQVPPHIPPHAPLHALHAPSLTVTLAPPEATDYAAMLDASASGYQDGEPWRQPQASAQQFDRLMAPAAFGQFGAGAGAGPAARQSGHAGQQLQSYTVPAPIPEPGHYHLMLIGMGLLWLYGGRRGAPAPWRPIRVEK